jgi:hypothetical protein
MVNTKLMIVENNVSPPFLLLIPIYVQVFIAMNYRGINLEKRYRMTVQSENMRRRTTKKVQGLRYWLEGIIG